MDNTENLFRGKRPGSFPKTPKDILRINDGIIYYLSDRDCEPAEGKRV